MAWRATWKSWVDLELSHCSNSKQPTDTKESGWDDRLVMQMDSHFWASQVSGSIPCGTISQTSSKTNKQTKFLNFPPCYQSYCCDLVPMLRRTHYFRWSLFPFIFQGQREIETEGDIQEGERQRPLKTCFTAHEMFSLQVGSGDSNLGPSAVFVCDIFGS